MRPGSNLQGFYWVRRVGQPATIGEFFPALRDERGRTIHHEWWMVDGRVQPDASPLHDEPLQPPTVTP